MFKRLIAPLKKLERWKRTSKHMKNKSKKPTTSRTKNNPVTTLARYRRCDQLEW